MKEVEEEEISVKKRSKKKQIYGISANITFVGRHEDEADDNALGDNQGNDGLLPEMDTMKALWPDTDGKPLVEETKIE